jgi:hypothetical protein
MPLGGGLEARDESVDRGNVDQRLVSWTFTMMSNGSFSMASMIGSAARCDPFRSRSLPRAHDLAAELRDVAEDPLVVGCDVDGVRARGVFRAVVNALNEGNARDCREWFAGKRVEAQRAGMTITLRTAAPAPPSPPGVSVSLW